MQEKYVLVHVGNKVVGLFDGDEYDPDTEDHNATRRGRVDANGGYSVGLVVEN